MKPIAIFRFSRTEEPGHFATFARRNQFPVEEFRLDLAAMPPADPGRYSGLVMMGGVMSVNDDSFHWNPPLLALLRAALAADVPIIGHCLGGQMLAKALGGVVAASPEVEIGWHPVTVRPSATAARWFGDLPGFTTFCWHNESFSIPAGAEHLLENRWCANQAFALGKHIGFQSHIEMTRDMVETWLQTGKAELETRSGPAIQTDAEMREGLDDRLAAQQAVADRVYARWAEGLIR